MLQGTLASNQTTSLLQTLIISKKHLFGSKLEDYQEIFVKIKAWKIVKKYF